MIEKIIEDFLRMSLLCDLWDSSGGDGSGGSSGGDKRKDSQIFDDKMSFAQVVSSPSSKDIPSMRSVARGTLTNSSSNHQLGGVRLSGAKSAFTHGGDMRPMFSVDS